LCSGIAEQLRLSPLLATMMVGFWSANRFKDGESLFQAVESIEEPIFALFFTLAGAHFDFQVIKLAGPLALLIVLARFAGKLIGTKLGAGLAGAPQVVRKYLGYGLLPQAGVTVGLILMAQPSGNSQLYEIMLNAVLGAVVISELIAPPLVKYALLRAGEGIEE
jgi:Kef-type K+ transport system membrane component KefB